jgi:transposase
MAMGLEKSVGWKTVGLDLGDRYSHFCMIDVDGQVVEQGRILTDGDAIRERFSCGPPSRVVLETGTHSPWVSRLLEALGHEVIVANPRRLRLIYQTPTKNDALDAEALARLGRMDVQLLAPIQHRGVQAQADRAVIQAREVLVRARTRLVNHIRGAIKSMGRACRGARREVSR